MPGGHFFVVRWPYLPWLGTSIHELPRRGLLGNQYTAGRILIR
jgi:hypothetical protein